MSKQEDCVFCDVRKIKSEVEIMYGADSSLHHVFEPLDPVVPGHLLVAPVEHYQDATESPYAAAMAMSVASRVAFRYRSSNILTSIGPPATQTVWHLHLHVLPRRFGDGLPLPWSGELPTRTRGSW